MNIEAKPTTDSAGNRFNLSPEGFAKERITAVKGTVSEMQQNNPEVLSLCAFGSMVRGNPRPDSDIDGYLYVDAASLVDALEPEDIARNGATLLKREEAEQKYIQTFVTKMTSKTTMTAEQVRQGIKVRPISRDIVLRHIDFLKKESEKMGDYDAAVKQWEQTHSGEVPHMPETVNSTTTLSGMFHLETGGGIRQYRNLVINELSGMGEVGEKIWHNVMRETEMMENYLSTTDKHYPRTLAEARKLYKVPEAQ